MNHIFLTKQQSINIAKLNFNENCFAYYTASKFVMGIPYGIYSQENTNTNLNNRFPNQNIITAPTYGQAFKFFRDEFLIALSIPCIKWMDEFVFKVNTEDGEFISKIYNTYEEAAHDCVDYINNNILISQNKPVNMQP